MENNALSYITTCPVECTAALEHTALLLHEGARAAGRAAAKQIQFVAAVLAWQQKLNVAVIGLERNMGLGQGLRSLVAHAARLGKPEDALFIDPRAAR